MFTKVLVANRGEIACRVIRTLREMGIKSVAVYTDKDRDSFHTTLADEAYLLKESYTDIEDIIEIAKLSSSKAIHPGYGFLSENEEFVTACLDKNIVFIGPKASSIHALGDKVSARNVAIKAGVDPVPGTNDEIKSLEEIDEFIKKYSLPIILKRSDGGGGHGISVIKEEKDLIMFKSAHSNDFDKYFIEKFVVNARHIETQCGRDTHGNFSLYSTRDCSIQRRNQKLIEEAPACNLSDKVEEKLKKWSKELFKTVDFTGLGTCEYLLEGDNLYFLEVNPRLQVEHTVTEEVINLDLVEQQLLIANGDEVMNENLKPISHSIELRITSEEPKRNMEPTSGKITKLQWPSGKGVRIETGIIEGDEVDSSFDSMIAKIIVTGKDRKTTVQKALGALKEFKIEGISTPKNVLEKILETSEFSEFKYYTKWLEEAILPNFIETNTEDSQNESSGTKDTITYKSFKIEIDGKLCNVSLPSNLFGGFSVSASQKSTRTAPSISSILGRKSEETIFEDDPKNITSPMEGVVVSVVVKEGQEVKTGDLLVVLEAMKMEKYINAKIDGHVKVVSAQNGDHVKQGDKLIELID